ncbi:MAG: chalcone isomerase family protein [Gammaproteobacteria bacterium]|nr:chalcone isomerase family protein [Gammaproteobacteria bacterium]
MNNKIYGLIACVCMMFLVTSVQAREFKGVNLPEEILLEGVNKKINLNGVGMRTKFVFDIYVGALYLESAANTREAVLSQNGAKRVFMHFVYDEVSAEKLVNGWNQGFEDNLTEEQLSDLADRIKAFNAMFDTVHAGDEVLLDYLPELGTRVTIKGEVKGMIEGDDFNQALLNIWLGDEPADEDLKEAMLNTAD